MTKKKASKVSEAALTSALKKHSGNRQKAADELGIHVSKLYRLMVAAKKENPAFDPSAFGVGKGGNHRVADAQLRSIWNCYVDSGYSVVDTAIKLGMGRSTVGERIAAAKKLFPELKGFDVTEHVARHRITSERDASKATLRDAVRTVAALQDRIKDLEWAAKASFKPAEWTLPNHPAKKREHMPYLLTSDFQVGEVIDPAETEFGKGYNSNIFIERYRQMIDTTIYLSTQHAGSDWTYPGFIYVRGGDAISGDIHPELMVTNDLTPEESVELVFEEESSGIEKLAEAFGKVDVKAPGAGGNHDRDIPFGKPWAKQAAKRSYERLVNTMLRKHFSRDKRVTFQVSDSYDIFFPIYDKNILVTHGDRIGSRGGQGFIGPVATIMRGAQKVIMEQAALGRNVDRVDVGHFHTFAYLEWVLANGCLPGYSEFAKQWRMRPAAPEQTLLYHHPRRGVVDVKPIIL